MVQVESHVGDLLTTAATELLTNPGQTARDLARALGRRGRKVDRRTLWKLLDGAPTRFERGDDGSGRWYARTHATGPTPLTPAPAPRQRQPIAVLGPASLKGRPEERERCYACGECMPVSEFRDVWVSWPVCSHCERRGRQPTLNADGGRQQGSTSSAVTRARGMGGILEPHDKMVYVTGGGDVWHLEEDCNGRRAGQAEAHSMGYRLHRVELVPLRSVRADRRPCKRCAC